MCYRIVTTAVLPLLLTRFSNWEPFQADKRAGFEQGAEASAIRQLQCGGRQFGQRVQHKRTQVHLVVGHFQARLVDQVIAKQQDIQIKGTRAPAFEAFAALVIFDSLQRVEQVQGRQVAVQGCHCVGVTRLPGQ